MEACLLTPHQPFLVSKVDRPRASGKEIIVKVFYCGICHTDLHLWDDGYCIEDGKKLKVSERPGFKFPVIPGHEISGQVVEVGSEENSAFIGENVVVYPIISCNECINCSRGMEQMCLGKTPFIGFSLPGGFAEYVKVPDSRSICCIPDDLPLQIAALLPCGAATAFNALKKAAPLLHDWLPHTMVPYLLIIGAGNLGQWAISLARHVLPRGTKIICTDTSTRRLAICKEIGADMTFSCTLDANDDGFIEDFLKLCPGKCEAVVDFVGSTLTVQRGIQCIKRGGTMILVGLHGGSNPARLCDLVLDSKTIKGSKMSSIALLKELLTLASVKNISGPPIVCVNMEDMNKTMAAFKEGDFEGKYVLKITK